ncbi:hypothetical protein ACQKWADRAFT_87248 [Trichoderma austrokoningii]
MSPHVLMEAEKHREASRLGTLTASFFFCFVCFSLFTLASLLVAHLDKYKRQIVRTLLGLFGNSDEEDDAQLRQNLFPSQQLDEKDLCQLRHQPLNTTSPSRGYKHSFTMAGPEFLMDRNDEVLFHIRVTMKCNGIRDLYDFGIMRQDTLQKRIDGAFDQLSTVNIVSVCATWLREKICRSYFDNSSLPDVQELCAFLQRRGSSRDMCCQIFYAAFHRLAPHLTRQLSLRVSGETLTDPRSIVDYVYDHWNRWAAAAQAASDHAAILAGASDPRPPSYPAHNHNLQTMPKEKYQKHVQENFAKLHRHQNHHCYHDGIKVQDGPAPQHEAYQPGDGDPYDLGGVSTWGSGPGQTETCRTRSDEVVCRQCSIEGWPPQLPTLSDGAPLAADTFLPLSPTVHPTVPDSVDQIDLFDEVAVAVPQQQKETTAASHQLVVPGPEFICPTCGQQGNHQNSFCAVNRTAEEEYYQMHIGRFVEELLRPKQVPSTQLKAGEKSSSQLIVFNSDSEAEQVQPTCSKDEGGRAFGSVPTLKGLRLTDGQSS